MTIIIDGYNLMKQLFARTIISQKERIWFFNLASRYAQKKHHSLIIIYDGGPVDRPTTEKKGPVTVVYSGTKATADDVIKTYIEEKVASHLLLVTTDRQLNNFAFQHNVPSLDSLDFYAFMKEQRPAYVAQKAEGTLHKLHPDETRSELDVLMEEGARMIPYKEEEVVKVQEKKASKKERLLRDIIRRL